MTELPNAELFSVLLHSVRRATVGRVEQELERLTKAFAGIKVLQFVREQRRVYLRLEP